MKSRSVVHLLRFKLVLVVVGTRFQISLVHVSPCDDDSIIGGHLDTSVLLHPEVEHLASCIDRQNVPLLCTLYLNRISSDCVCQSLLAPQR